MTSCAVPSFTSGLFIDREHPVFAGLPFRDSAGQPPPRLLRLRIPDNADAVVWSVLRVLARLDAARWLPALLLPHLPPGPLPLPLRGQGREAIFSIEFWRTVAALRAAIERS